MFNNIKWKLKGIKRNIEEVQKLLADTYICSGSCHSYIYDPYENGKNIWLYAQPSKRTRNLIKAKKLMEG